jgi:teichuronic acid biosynthesis glycosyltransferase TuaC
MRFLFISNIFPNPHQPTLGVFNLHLVRALAREHDVQVVCPVPWLLGWRSTDSCPAPNPLLAGLDVFYPRFYYTPKVLRRWYGTFMWRSVRRTVLRLLNAGRPDAVFGYWAHPDGEVAVRAARAAGVPAVVMVGGSDVLLLARDAGRHRRIAKVFQAADAIVTVGHDLKEKVANFSVGPDKVHVLHRGVDEECFFPGAQHEARGRLGIPPERRVLLWVGRLVPVKGLDILLEACSILRERGQPFHLFLVGEGPLRKALEANAVARGLEGHVSFVGPLAHDRLPDWYRAADLTVLSSFSEGVPNVVRESLACGTPVVATRVGGVPELVTGPVSRMVPPADPVALAGALAAALAERSLAGPCRYPSVTCAESAASLVSIVRGLVPAPGKNCDVAARPGPRFALARTFYGLARRVLAAALPRWLFLVRGPTDCRRICLTFDDGPDPCHTPRLLDVLKDHGVRASFFVVGEKAERYPDLVRRMAADGHVVGNHSFYHTDPARTSAGQLLAEVRRTHDLLGRLTGRAVPLARPPHGKVTARKLWRLWRAGQTVVLWNVDPKDYACRSADQLRAWFRARPLKAGDLVLMHDRLPYAAEVLPDLIAGARRQSLSFATVAEWAQ